MPPTKRKEAAAATAKAARSAPTAEAKNTVRVSAAVHRARATARRLVEQHGNLTQLNAMYPADLRDSDESVSHTTTDSRAGSTVGDSDMQPLSSAEQVRREKVAERRTQLLQLPPACLPTYVQLSECGLPPATCSFASIIIQRALQFQQSLVAAQRDERQ